MNCRIERCEDIGYEDLTDKQKEILHMIIEDIKQSVEIMLKSEEENKYEK